MTFEQAFWDEMAKIAEAQYLKTSPGLKKPDPFQKWKAKESITQVPASPVTLPASREKFSKAK